jgi:large subunit ribosomal protein L25
VGLPGFLPAAIRLRKVVDMADFLTISVQPRTAHGTRIARRLRQEGRIPAVIYGHKEATVAVTVAAEELQRAVKAGNPIVDLKADGTTQKAQIRELQWDHLGQDVLHVDFKRVSEDERIVTHVKIELRGIHPTGAVMDQPIHSLEIECPVIAVPQTIRLDIGGMQVGQVIHVKDLTLPPNVKAMVDPEAVVVVAKAHHIAEVAVAAPAEPGANEPEVIGRKAEEAEEEGE